ncbi:MAG: HipA family kinase [Mycobacteriales bacterium]
MLKTVTATRYVTPLREGGSLPGLMESDDLGTYVVKYVGAGQGRKTLVSEIVCAGLARALRLPVPDLVLVDVDPLLGRSEPDEEVQDLLQASAGLNLGMDFLPGSFGFDPLAHTLNPLLASTILWFDAYVGNVDRSWRNPNLLMWHRTPWLIDHGACLVFHHSWGRSAGWATKPYDATGHVLSEQATARDEVDASALTDGVLLAVLDDVPDVWLADEEGFDAPEAVRRAYVAQLRARLQAEQVWRP